MPSLPAASDWAAAFAQDYLAAAQPIIDPDELLDDLVVHLTSHAFSSPFIQLVLDEACQQLGVSFPLRLRLQQGGQPFSLPVYPGSSALPAVILERYPSLTRPFVPRKRPPSSSGDMDEDERDQDESDSDDDEDVEEEDDFPSALDTAPSALISSFRSHCSSFQHALPPPHDLPAFHNARSARRTTLGDAVALDGPLPRPAWSPPIEGDFAVGELMGPDGDPAPDLRTRSMAHVDIVFLTTFPVSKPDLELHPKARDGHRRWASTALKVQTLQSLAPNVAPRMIWLDSNPCPRNGGIKTDASDPAQQLAFTLTLPILSSIHSRALVCTNAGNRSLFIASLPPSHVLKTLPPVTPSSFLQPADDFDDCWSWDGSADPALYRPIQPNEVALYAHLNMMDTTSLLAPLRPLSLFVRRYRGLRDQLFFFTPHPCTLDAFRYPSSSFASACDELQRTFQTLEHLVLGDLDAAPPFSPILKPLFQPDGLATGYLHSSSSPLGTLGGLIDLRGIELRNQVPFAIHELSPSVLSLAAQHLLRSTDVSALSQLDLSKRSRPPHSILGVLLTHFASLNLKALGEREKAAEAQLLQPGDVEYEVLEDARRSPKWIDRLHSLGVEPLFFTNNAQFRRGHQLASQRPRISQLSQDSYRLYALKSAHPGAVLLWSPHLARHHSDPLAVSRGFLSSLDPQRPDSAVLALTTSSSSGKRLRERLFFTKKPCDECETAGFDCCVFRFEDAVKAGLVQNLSSVEEVVHSLELWRRVVLDSSWPNSAKATLEAQMSLALAAAKASAVVGYEGGDDEA